MKTLFISISLLCSLYSTAQITYEDTDWIIDQTQVTSNGDADTLEIDFDQNGSKDMRITSWSNHSIGSPLTSMTALMLHGFGNGGLEVAPNQTYISDCPATSFAYGAMVGYLYNSDFSNPYADQYVKVPFKHIAPNGVHYGLLYVRYVGTTVTIEGYAYNQTVNGACDCNSTIWLALDDNEMNDQLKGDFDYYNLMGQQVEHPEGLVLKVFESGSTEKTFITQ